MSRRQLWKLEIPEGCPIKGLVVDNDGCVHVLWGQPMRVNFIDDADRSMTMMDIVLSKMTITASKID